MFCAPVHQSEYNKLEVPAPKALDTKSRAANRGDPKTGRAAHQTMNLRLLTKLKSKVQTQKNNSVPGFSAFSGAFQWHRGPTSQSTGLATAGFAVCGKPVIGDVMPQTKISPPRRTLRPTFVFATPENIIQSSIPCGAFA